MRDNADLIADALKTEATERAATLRAAMSDKNIQPSDLQAALDALQQTIFTIGANLYRQANSENYDVAAENDLEEAMPGADAGARATSLDEADVATIQMNEAELDIDATITADYEAIE
jgi:molecular chaperone DnaK